MTESRVQVRVLMAPIRTAEEQWRLAGPETCLGTMNPGSGLVYVGGKGGDAALTREEWQKYESLVNGWRAGTVQRFDDAPVISMREVDEDLQLDALTRRAPSHIASSFREIERLLQEYVRCLSDEEREEIIRQIGSTVLPLKEAVLRAEEIWIDGDCNERDELIKAEREIERLRAMLKNDLEKGGAA